MVKEPWGEPYRLRFDPSAARPQIPKVVVASHLVKAEPENEALVDQPRLFRQAERGHRASKSHSTEGTGDSPQGCHDRI